MSLLKNDVQLKQKKKSGKQLKKNRTLKEISHRGRTLVSI